MKWHSWAGWLILIGVFFLQWLFLFSIRGPAWDAVFYYVYGRSMVFDGDLQFTNDYRLSYPTSGEHFQSKQFDRIETKTGRASNIFAIGSSLLWLPWIGLLRVISTLSSPQQIQTGFERFFIGNIAFLASVFSLIAVGLGYMITRKFTSSTIALIAAITLSFTTPLLYYQFREPMYAHATSALSVALSVYVWSKQYDRVGTIYQGLGLGALIGLAGLVRWQNMALLIIPLSSTLISLWQSVSNQKEKPHLRPALFFLLSIIGASLAVFSLQMSVWKVLFDSFLTIPQGGSFLNWRAPFLVPFLFSSFRGLLPWMPIFFFAFVGLMILSKRDPRFGIPLLLTILFFVYLNSSTLDWFAGGSYGPRRLSDYIMIFVLGYGVFLQWIPDRLRYWIVGLIAFVLVLHQWILLRYGIAERLGGRVLSMEPQFLWQDVPLQNFVADLLKFVPELWNQPIDFLVFPGSPLDTIVRQQVWPSQHFTVLLLTSFFVLLLVVGFILLRRHKIFNIPPLILAIISGGALIVGNLWILLGS